MTEEQKELFKKDPLIKLILEQKEPLGHITLVGGAVIDILEGRIPKDYDLTNIDGRAKKYLNLEYSHDTKTATTYKTYIFDKRVQLNIQVLKTSIDNFDFSISAAILTINHNKEMSLAIDENAFKLKTLIPQSASWEDRNYALNSLKRIPHWKKKGYTIKDETYLSLLNVIGKKDSKHS